MDDFQGAVPIVFVINVLTHRFAGRRGIEVRHAFTLHFRIYGVGKLGFSGNRS